MIGRAQEFHWSGRRRYSVARSAARSTPATATPSHGAQGKFLTTSNSSNSSSSRNSGAVCVPGLSPRMGVLGPPWILMVSSDSYSFSSGALSGPTPRELLWLMARSAEQPENGWLSILDTSLPGLLSSSSEPQQSELLSGHGEVPPVAVPVGAGDAGVSWERKEGLEGLRMVGGKPRLGGPIPKTGQPLSSQPIVL